MSQNHTIHVFLALSINDKKYNTNGRFQNQNEIQLACVVLMGTY